MNRKLTPVAASLLALVSQYAAAQNPPSALPEIQVKGSKDVEYAPQKSQAGNKAGVDVHDIPQSVTVVNRAVLDAQAATTMTEALRNVPGITISAGEGGQIGDNINLRGYNARTDIYLDGVRDRGQYTRDTFNLEAIEVLKGASSMLFGRGSTGGVINQTSRKPNKQDSREVKVGIGSQKYVRVSADLNQALSDNSAFRVGAFAQDNDSTRDVTHTRHYGIAPSYRWGMGTDTDWTLSALIQRNRDIPDYGFPVVNGLPIDAPTNRYYGFTDDQFNQDINVVSLSVRHKISSDLTLLNKLQFGRYVTAASPTPLQLVLPIASGAPLDKIKVNYSTRDRVVSDRTLSNQTDLIAKFKAFGIDHVGSAGIEIAQDDSNPVVYSWSNLGGQFLSEQKYAPKPTNALRELSTNTDTTAKSLGIYINEQANLNAQWKAVIGLRFDRFDLRQEAYNYKTKLQTKLASVDNTTSVRTGLIYQPNELQSIYLSYGTSFNPSGETLAVSAANVNLDPEKNRSIELGSKIDLLDGALSVNGAIFKVEKTNARTTDPVSSVVSLRGNTQVQGVELGIVGRINSAWQVLAGYTFLDGKINEAAEVNSGIVAKGKTLPNTPRNNASLWTTYAVSNQWEVGGGVVYAGKRYLNNFESAWTQAYTRYDATLAYKAKDWDLRLNLQNLSDAKYFEVASGGRATPAKGRSVILNLTYRY